MRLADALTALGQQCASTPEGAAALRQAASAPMEPQPVAYVQRIGSYQGIPQLGCLLTIEAEKRLKVNAPLYDAAAIAAARREERKRWAAFVGELMLDAHVLTDRQAAAIERAADALRAAAPEQNADQPAAAPVAESQAPGRSADGEGGAAPTRAGGGPQLAWLDHVAADLEGAGYAAAAANLGAHSVGAPHLRQRLYWVAHADGRHAGAEGLQRGGQHRQQQAHGGAGAVAGAKGSDDGH